jgi:hypothetical protein
LQAIVLRDLNLFSAAIKHYNKAVQLNDNRSVYRSVFLLDQDQTLRNVDLSLIFQEYGFNGWADRKAVNAINDDFGNYTGHIMYAGALSGQENRNTAFISETLQTRILQPANINSFNNFNQYTSFLEQPSLGGTGNITGGSFNTRSIVGQIFGALPDQNLAYQAIVLDSSTDGWNDIYGDEFKDISALLKWDASRQDSFLLQFSDSKATRLGDLLRRFEFDFEPNPDIETTGELTRLEAGYRHHFRQGTDLLAYVAYVELDSFSSLGTTE